MKKGNLNVERTLRHHAFYCIERALGLYYCYDIWQWRRHNEVKNSYN